MRCSTCHFENIPGQDRCLRCGSILEAAGRLVDVHPPRMAGWRGPVRGLVRWFRGHRAIPEGLPGKRIRRGLDRIASDALIGLIISVVPGLAHFVKGRFREVRLLVLVWAVLLSAGLFLYGSSVGSLLIGLAIGLHAWIAIQFGLIKVVTGFVERVGLVLLVTAGLALLYWAAPRLVFRGYTGGYTALTIPEMRIESGDYLLVRRTEALQETLPRGTLVLIRPLRLRNYRTDLFNQQPLMIGQIVGLPGETVALADGLYSAGGEPLDPARFPVPGWLQRSKTGIAVHPGSYFVSLPYSLRGHGGATLTNQAIHDVSLFGAEEIQGRAFMRWWPLGRRGFIE